MTNWNLPKQNAKSGLCPAFFDWNKLRGGITKIQGPGLELEAVQLWENAMSRFAHASRPWSWSSERRHMNSRGRGEGKKLLQARAPVD